MRKGCEESTSEKLEFDNQMCPLFKTDWFVQYSYFEKVQCSRESECQTPTSFLHIFMLIYFYVDIPTIMSYKI
jgi:hypothetical protein